MQAADVLTRSPVIPVVALEDAALALPLADALLAGGIPVVEITLRTPVALDAVRQLRATRPAMTTGVGTVLDVAQRQAALEAGAEFLVSPGATPALIAADDGAAGWLPGAATVSECLALADAGYSCLKFFPARASGGPDFLGAVRAVLPRLTFCPTGGIDAASAPDYLALANVAAVGGSWLTPTDALRDGDFERIEALARAARALSPP